MDRAYHPAWREVIIPFLDDQRKLDQLWCSSKALHQPILAVKHFTSWCRPMNSPIKNRGIYPSYLSRMNNLRSLTVKLEPRLEPTWLGYEPEQCRAFELFSDSIPTTVTTFETRVTIVNWGTLDKQQQRDMLKAWLDRFPDIELGKEMKRYIYRMMVDIFTVGSEDDMGVIADNLDWLRYQYITTINIPNLKKLLPLLEEKHDDELTTLFTTGIVDIRVRNDPRGIGGIGRMDFTEADDPYITFLYHTLPNLRRIFGYVSHLPSGLRTFQVSGLDSLQTQSIPALPDSLDTLVIPWNILDFDRLWLPRNLAEFHITSVWGVMQPSHITIENFTRLIATLPPTLEVLRISDLYPSEVTLDYWPLENIRALPRMLKVLYCSPEKWTVPGEQVANIVRLQALPQHLSELSLPNAYIGINYGLDPVELMQLPPRLKNIVLTIDPEHISTFTPNILHFIQLDTLTLIINLPSDSPFPIINLPANLKNLILYIIKLGSEGLSVPLHLIRWPERMDAIKIDVQSDLQSDAVLEEGEYFTISHWHLPKYLSELNLEGVGVRVLPTSWPEGFNTFTCDITDYLSGISEVWPDIERMAYYLPNSTLCYIAAFDNNREGKTRYIRTNPSTGRPQQYIEDYD